MLVEGVLVFTVVCLLVALVKNNQTWQKTTTDLLDRLLRGRGIPPVEEAENPPSPPTEEPVERLSFRIPGPVPRARVEPLKANGNKT